MTSRPRPVLFALAILLSTALVSTTARAQDPDVWLGRRVVTKTGVEIREVFPGKNYQELVGPPNVELGRIGIGRISRVVGEWLELKSDDDSETRWVREWELVRFNDAHDYFTAQVKAHPRDATAYLERALFVRTVSSRPELPDLPRGLVTEDKLVIPGGLTPLPKTASAPTLDRGDPFATAFALARDLTKPTSPSFDPPPPFMTTLAPSRVLEIPGIPSPPPVNSPQGDPFFVGIARAFASRPIADDLDEAIRLDPKLAYAYLLRGYVREDMYKLEEAMADYSHCIRLAPNDTQAYVYRAALLFQMERYTEAVADYSAIIQIDPDRVDLYTWLGASRALSGDHDGAIPDLEVALRSDPRNTRTIYYYGLAWAGKGKHDRAIAEFTRAMDLESQQTPPKDDAYAYLFDARGSSWFAQGDFDRAITDYTEAIRRAPLMVEYLVNRAAAYREKKQYDQALKDYDAAAFVEPHGTRVPIQRSLVLHLKGRQAEAIAALDEVIRLHPEDAKLLGEYAQAFARIKELDRGIVCLDTAIRVEPEDAKHLVNRSSFWLSKGEYDKTIADCDEVIRRQPADVTAYSLRAAARYKLSQYDETIADCDEALALEPQNVFARLQRGRAWYEESLYEKAAADFEAAAKVAPKSLDVLRARASFWSYCPEARFRNGARALEAATIACESTGWKDAHSLCVLSFALAETGDFDGAVARLKKSIELETDEPLRKREIEILDMFKDRKPYRRLYRPD
jgi:tetratricopeptide (TPR) repeat protein